MGEESIVMQTSDVNVNVTDFLLNNLDALTATSEVYIGDRFIAAGMPFIIRAMTSDEFEVFQKQCTRTKFSKGKRETEFNNKRFNEMVITACTVEPNFKDAETLKRAGVNTPEQLINKSLKSGEIQNLANEISAFSGFDKTLDEMKDDSKND
jgi:Phage XkdN-like tail assembly chaperone protein, TAC